MCIVVIIVFNLYRGDFIYAQEVVSKSQDFLKEKSQVFYMRRRTLVLLFLASLCLR